MTELIKRLQEQSGFSESEVMIANYILKNYRLLPSLSTRSLAKKTFTSSAVIVRFCQKLGFHGYTDFRVRFMAEMMQYVDRPQREKLILTDRDSIHSLLNKVTSIEFEAIKNTRELLDPADFTRAMAILNKTRYVDFYATDNNLDIADMAATSFIMADKCSTVHPAMTMQYLQASGTPKDHVSFFISRTGENRLLVTIARFLRLRDMPIILITATPRSSLATLADVSFCVATVDKMEELGPRVFLTGAKYVVDAMFAMLMTRVNYRDSQLKEKWLNKNFYY